MKKQSKLVKKRRIEGKTNYLKRLRLLKERKLRLIVRKTNRFLIMQIIESEAAQDKVLYSVNTKELLKEGWPKQNQGSLKSVPAAYLGGLLLAKKAKEIKSEVILDMGLIPNTKGSKIYAATKGVHDGGIKVNVNEAVVPSKERLEGKDSKLDLEILNKIKSKIIK
jgi:large subunit ribosomal protein L18